MQAVRSQDDVAALARALLAHVEAARALGVRGVPRASARVEGPGGAALRSPTIAPGHDPRALHAGATTAGAAAPPAQLALGESRADTLEELRADIGDCTRCKLAPHRTHLVFGVGNPKARLVFVGEAPGADEDARGEPFVGRAGQLLTEIITKGMKLRRDDVYICNVIKCRPPGNRNPEPDEVASCEPFLRRQLELIAPQVVVGLGKFAVQTLLRSKSPITQLRGRWFDYHGIMLMPTFHPAYLLRNPADKRLVWEDVQKVMRVLGLPVAAR
jgi:DNA polymerase